MYKTIVCYFNLSRIPLVRNTWSLPVPSRQAVATLKHRWARNIPYLNTLLGAKPCRQTLKPIRTTCIETLQIDIILTSTEMCGLMGSGSTTPLHPRFTRAETQGKKVQWAICAALKKLCDSGIEGFGLPGWRSEKAGYYLVVDMLVLNVVPPMGAEEMAEGDGGGQTSQDEDRLAAAQHVADELVSLWTKIWAGADFKAKYYHGLIDRIMRVRISVDGEIMRERDLGRELERGRKERERSGRRVGW